MKDFLLKTAKLNRSIISDDFEKTLSIISSRIPLKILKFPTGKKCFDWIIPKKWTIKDAYIKDETGKKILDWKKNPLHVVIGSLPINKKISKKELLNKIYVSEKYPDLVPYKFKFYELDWGFCMAKNQRDKISGNKFNVLIDSKYTDGDLLVGEHTIKGKSKKAVVLMAHIDHPFQVNDGLAGAAVLIKLAEFLKNRKPAYTLKFLFLPERIGSIAYLHRNYEKVKEIIGGIFCEMPGTPNYPLVLQHSKNKESKVDRIAKFVLEKSGKNHYFADCFAQVKNDDAFYNSPGIDIPCVSLSRSEPRNLQNNISHCPFYHTSGDNIENFDFNQAEEFLEVLKEMMFILDEDKVITRKYVGVPNLSRHNLWIDWQGDLKRAQNIDKILYNLDNGKSIFDIAELTKIDFREVLGFIEALKKKNLVDFKK